ncbi:cache domain-containing protein [Thiomicrorhabdus sp.]|uniref:sensor domain-containing diguanylate cyclase n=1 Tax=Thiomicrorhabdus sp. TaxID=2039724 RepID=UPI003563F53B
MVSDKFLIKLLAVAPVLVIPAMVAFVALLLIHSEQAAFEKTLNRLEVKLIESKQAAIRAQVDSIVNLTAYRKSIIKKELHERIKRRVEDACKIAHSIHDQFSSTYSEEEVKKIIVEALRSLTWNDGESYIWIVDYDGVSHLSPQYLSHFEGESIIDLQDANGYYVIRQEIALARARGKGFMWDSFTRPGQPQDKQFAQLAYVKALGYYDWYLGSAEFLDTAQKITDKELLETISTVDNNGSDYLFILGKEGRIILNSARPDLEGKMVMNSDDPHVREVGRKIEHALDEQSDDFIQYRWVNPVTRKEDLKFTYVKAVPNSQWVIGSGYYEGEIEAGIDSVKKTLEVEYRNRMEDIRKISVLSFILAVLVSLYLTLAVKRLLLRYQSELEVKNLQLTDLNTSLEARVARRTKELQKANGQLELLATTDTLTGVLNRYAFMKALDEEVLRAQRYQNQFSLIMFDIDFFKQVNDQYGHDSGDVVLVSLANLVQSCLRDVDKLFRLGGEEFIILLPNTDVDSAAAIAERIRQIVEKHHFERIGNLAISLGVVEHLPDELAEATLKRADIALYQSKEQGRNRVSIVES